MNSRRQFLRTSLGAGLGLATGTRLAQANGELKQFVKQGKALGTKASITVLHESEAVAQQGAEAAFAELQTVERMMSIYRSDSQLSKLNRHGVLDRPHPYLLEVMNCAERVSRSSRGAFDVTVQPLWRLYSDAQRAGRTPSSDEVKNAARQVDWRGVRTSKSRIRLVKPVRAVTLNGIAQGYAADRAKAALQTLGVKHALIDTGELTSLGRRPAGGRWTVGVQHPRHPDAFAALVPLGSRSLATSGDYETTFSANRQRHHLFDPQTGESPQTFSSVSVIATTAMEADALSTALFAMNVESGLKLLKEFRADALLIRKDGRTFMTDGFPRPTG